MLKAVRPIVVVLGLMSGAAIYPAVAQEDAALTAVPEIEVVTEADVVAACTSEGATEDACLAALEAYAAYLESTGIDPEAFEQAMVDLVVAMGETELPDSVREIVAAAVSSGAPHRTVRAAQAFSGTAGSGRAERADMGAPEGFIATTLPHAGPPVPTVGRQPYTEAFFVIRPIFP